MRQRVVTALLLAVPALLALALRTPWPLAALGLAAAGVGGWEADRILDPRYSLCLGMALILFIPTSYKLLTGFEPVINAPLILAIVTMLGAITAALPKWNVVRSFAGNWVACPLLAILLLHRSAPSTGLWCLSPALMALVPVWAGDIAAIFAGRAFGKRLLMPKVSPKKTVEGSIANLAAAVLTAWLLGRLLGLPDARSLGAGLAAGTLGQAGDLFESWLKRRAGVKDSGTLLPGHGGVLDRIDSVLFAAPAVALILLG